MSQERGGVRGGLTFVTKKVVIFFEGFPKSLIILLKRIFITVDCDVTLTTYWTNDLSNVKFYSPIPSRRKGIMLCRGPYDKPIKEQNP